jgi:hypothetical protein
MQKEQEALKVSGKDSDVNVEGKKTKKKKTKKAKKAEDKIEQKKIEASSSDDKPEIQPDSEDSATIDDVAKSKDDAQDDQIDDTKSKSGESDKANDGSSSSGSSSDYSAKDNDNKDMADSSINGDTENIIFLGLRVYTHREAPAVVNGQLRHEMATSFAGLAIDGLG